MASPCIYTYKGQEYTYAEFRAKLADGLLKELTDSGAVNVGMPAGFKPTATIKTVGVTNAATKEMLETLGIDPIAKSIRLSNPEMWDSVIEEVKGGLDPRDEVNKLVHSTDPLINKRVQALVLIDRINTLNEHDAIQRELEKAIDDGDVSKQSSLRVKEEQNRVDIMNNAIADEKIGGQWGAFGSFRQSIADREFNITSIERRAKNAAGKSDLSEADLKTFTDLADKHKDLQEQYKKLVEQHKLEKESFEKKASEEREQYAKDVLNKYKNEIQEGAAPKERKPSLTAEQKQRKAELKNKLFSRFNDVTSMATLLADKEFYEYSGLLFKEAAGDFAHFAKEITTSFKKIAKEDIPELWKKLGGSEESVDTFKSLAKKVKEESEGELHEGLKPMIDKMVYDLVKNDMGIKIDEVVDKIAKELKSDIPNIDKQELKDMISGYGKFSELTKDEVKRQVSEIKSQGRLDSALEATERGELPLRNGIERAKKSQETREKRAKIAKNIKEKNLVSPLTPEESSARYKTDLEAHHRRLENAIEDVNKEISENKRREKSQGKTFTDDRTKELEEQLKDLKKLRDETIGKPEMTDEQRVEAATKNIEKSIEKIKDDIEALKSGGTINKPVVVKKVGGLSMFGFGKEKKILSSDKIDNLKNLKAVYEAELSELLPEAIKDKAILDKYRKGRERRLKFLEDKLAKGDFAPKPKVKSKIVPDAETQKVLDEIARVEHEVNNKIEELRLQNRSRFEKGIALASEYQRFSLFAGALGMRKLLFASLSRPIMKVPVEVSQTILSHTPVLKDIMKKSITHYTPIPFKGSFIKYYSTLFAKETALEAWRELKSQSNWNIAYGDHKGLESSSFLSKPQRMHGAMKTFVKIAQFESSLAKGLETLSTTIDPNTGQYYDITKPEVKALAIEGAKQDALSDVFMSNSEVSRVIKNAFETMGRSNKAGVQALGLIASQQMPIVKVPTNFYVEVLEKTPVVGMIKAYLIVKRAGEKGAIEPGKYPGGIKNLTPEQARSVARAMENQIVGAMGIAIGAALYKAYGDDAKKKLEEGKGFLHNALTELVKLGVGYASLMDKGDVDTKTKEVKKYGAVSGLAKATWEHLSEVTKEHPILKSAVEAVRNIRSDETIKIKVAQMLTTLLVPSGSREIAQYMDVDKNGDPIKRTTKDWEDVLKLNIPGLRETLGTAWDDIDAQRTKVTKLEELKETKKKEWASQNPNYDLIKKINKTIDSIEEENKKNKIEKLIIDEKAYYDLAKALGKTPHAKRGLSKDEQRAVNKLKLK